MKQIEWELYLNDLLGKSEYEQVYSFFEMTKLAEEGNAEDAKTHAFLKDERCYFDAKMLEAFLGQKFRLAMSRADLYRLIMVMAVKRAPCAGGRRPSTDGPFQPPRSWKVKND